MRSLLWASLLALSPAGACAQTPYFPPPGPGTPVRFVACPERTAGGSWIATDPDTYFTYSLAGALPPPPNVYIRVSGVVSPALGDVPGWLLTPITVEVGRTPCLSRGVLQHYDGPWFPAFGSPVPVGPARRY